MAKQSEIAAEIAESTKKVEKIGRETRKLITKIEELQVAIGNQDDASPELLEKNEALKAQLGIVDDLVPDETEG